MAKRYSEMVIEVRYRETDSMGHVAAPVYFDYMLHAYLAYMHDLLGTPLQEKLPHIMGKTSCEYLMPARYGDTIAIHSAVTRFGTKSFDLEYLMHAGDGSGDVIAKGFSSHVMFNYEARSAIAVPEAFKEAVIRFQHCI